MHVFTSVTANYIPKARVLAHSVKAQHPDYPFHLVLSDRIPEGFDLDQEPFDSILTVEDLPIPGGRAWMFKHSVVEMCTAVKGMAFQEIAKRYQTEKIMFLDPDIAVFGSLQPLSDALDRNSILLTPHLTVPEETDHAVIDNEICSLKHGVFNFGFLAIRYVGDGKACIDWWAKRCQSFCYDDIPNGLFTDQKWSDLIPCFFEDYKVLREPVYNVATWNLTHRLATGSLKTGVLINGQPLCFYHFSGFDSGAQKVMLERYGDHSPVLSELRDWYIAECDRMEQAKYGKQPSIYEFFDNGERITRSHRLLYRSRVDLQQAFPDPFAVSEDGHNYCAWAKANLEIETLQPGLSHAEYQQKVLELQAQLTHPKSLVKAIVKPRLWRMKTRFRKLAALMHL